MYRRPKLSLIDGLMRLMSDKDMLGMLEDLSFSRIIEVYFIPPPAPRLSITFEKNVAITEVDDIDAKKHHFGTPIEPTVKEVDERCDENIVEVERDTVDIVEKEVRQWKEILTNNEDYGIQFKDLFDWNVEFDDHLNEQHEVRQHGDERNEEADVMDQNEEADIVNQNEEAEVPDEEHNEVPDKQNEEADVMDQNEEADIVDQNEEHEVPDEEHNEVPDEQHDEEFNDSDYEQEVPILNDDANFEKHYTWDDDRSIVHEGSEDDDSDELKSLDSDEEECGKRKKCENVYSGRADNEDPQFHIGLQFETNAQLKNLIKQYSVKHG
ncbi:hypothetical protein Adt_33669 [Abeliophyllum distichum]|uniref:ATPase n=1 Tax=Abeliophyllum distichum TaxID=126358 RepID=A0ABD1QX21_9LAMI